MHVGGAVAEWSKALLSREKITEDPRFAPRPGQPLRKPNAISIECRFFDEYSEDTEGE